MAPVPASRRLDLDAEVLFAFLRGEAEAPPGRTCELSAGVLTRSGRTVAQRYLVGEGELREVLVWVADGEPDLLERLGALCRELPASMSLVRGLGPPAVPEEALAWRALWREAAERAEALRSRGWRRLADLPELACTDEPPPCLGIFERHQTGYRLGIELWPKPFVIDETWCGPEAGPVLAAARLLASAQWLPLNQAIAMVAAGAAS